MHWHFIASFFSVLTAITSNGMITMTRNDSDFSEYRLEGLFASDYGSLTQRDALFNPKKIFIPETEQDVMDIVNIALQDESKIVVKSGGHSYIGASTCNDCYQIDMKYFNKTEFIRDLTDKITSIKVGVGQTLGRLYNILAEENVAIIGGNCISVAAGGHFQSSSIGLLTRGLGGGMDRIQRITLIDSKGKLQSVSKWSADKNDGDLFWAILGSAPGSWGIILEYEFEPIYDEDYPFSYAYRFGYYYTKQVFEYMLDEFMRVLNNDLLKKERDVGGMYLHIVPYVNNTYICTVNIYWTGLDHGSIFNEIADTNTSYYEETFSGFDSIPSVELFDIDGLFNWNTNETMSISAMMQFWASDTLFKTRYYVQHSSFDKDMMDELISSETRLDLWISDVVDAVDSVLNEDDITALIQFWNFQIPDHNQIIDGKEIDAMNPMNNAVSYTHRNVFFDAGNWIMFENGTDDVVVNKALEITNNLRNVIDFNLTQISDIEQMAFPDTDYNDMDLDIDWKKYFNGNSELYQRLREIKTRIDPNNMFNGPLTIKPLSQEKAKESRTALYIWICSGAAAFVVLLFCIFVYCKSKNNRQIETDVANTDDESRTLINVENDSSGQLL